MWSVPPTARVLRAAPPISAFYDPLGRFMIVSIPEMNDEGNCLSANMVVWKY